MRKCWILPLIILIGLLYYYISPVQPVVLLDPVKTIPLTHHSADVALPATTTSSLVTTPPASKETTPEELLFTGDVMLGRFVETLMQRHGSEYLTADLHAFMQQPNRTTVTNFESAMAVPHVHTPNGGFQFSTDPQWLVVLLALNVVYASLANNHSVDYGVVGYQNTIEELNRIGVTAFGHPTTVGTTSVTYVPLDGKTVGLIGLHTLYRMPDEQQLAQLLTELTQSSDLQIAYVHWGVEYEPTHSANQQLLAETLADAGIDLIVGHHPHVVQDIQLVAGVPVVYSLGNFIFDQYFSSAVQQGLLLGVVLEGDKLVLNLYPHASHEALSRPKLLSGEAKQLFLNDLAKRSDTSLASAIESGQIVLRLNVD